MSGKVKGALRAGGREGACGVNAPRSTVSSHLSQLAPSPAFPLPPAAAAGGRGKKAAGTGKKAVSRSAKAGLQFPVGIRRAVGRGGRD